MMQMKIPAEYMVLVTECPKCSSSKIYVDERELACMSCRMVAEFE